MTGLHSTLVRIGITSDMLGDIVIKLRRLNHTHG